MQTHTKIEVISININNSLLPSHKTIRLCDSSLQNSVD
jgi:hypothetical protein